MNRNASFELDMELPNPKEQLRRRGYKPALDALDNNFSPVNNKDASELGHALDDDEMDNTWKEPIPSLCVNNIRVHKEEIPELSPREMLKKMAKRNQTLELETGKALKIEKSSNNIGHVVSPVHPNSNFEELFQMKVDRNFGSSISDAMDASFDSQSIRIQQSSDKGNRKLQRKKSKTQFVDSAQIVRNNRMMNSFNTNSSKGEQNEDREYPGNEFDTDLPSVENEQGMHRPRMAIPQSIRIRFPIGKKMVEPGSTKTSSAKQEEVYLDDSPRSSRHSVIKESPTSPISPAKDLNMGTEEVRFQNPRRSSKKRLSQFSQPPLEEGEKSSAGGLSSKHPYSLKNYHPQVERRQEPSSNLFGSTNLKKSGLKIRLEDMKPHEMKNFNIKSRVSNIKDSSASKDVGVISATYSGKSKVSDLISNPTGFFFNYRNHINFSNLVDSESKIVTASNKDAIEGPPEEQRFCVLVWNDGTVYEGGIKNGRLNGQGRMKHSSGFVLEGDFQDGKFEGSGTYIHKKLKYVGLVSDNVPNGEGTEELETKYKYQGSFVNGKKNGLGELDIFKKGLYKGNFKNNYFSGYGHFKWKDGREYMGCWSHNLMSGKGKMFWPDGRKYEGRYSKNLKDGFGVFEYADGRVYMGQWKKGKQNGQALFYDLAGNEIVTMWENGHRVSQFDRPDLARQSLLLVQEKKGETGSHYQI